MSAQFAKSDVIPRLAKRAEGLLKRSMAFAKLKVFVAAGRQSFRGSD